MNPLAIRCHQIQKTYRAKPPVEALRGIDLHVEQGECFGVLGPNGAGKTTAIEIMEGLLSPSSGRVEILGHSWDDEPDEIRHEIGITLQETTFSERLAVREIVDLFRSFYRSGIDPREAIARVSLEEKANSWVKTLSGGQKQRLAVATALVGDPRLLFLDEPTTGLDPQSRRQIWGIVADFRRRGRTVLLTTHYMEEAERLCDRVAIIDHGQIIALGTPSELIAGIGGDHVIEITFAGDESAAGDALDGARWRDVEGVTSVSRLGDCLRLAVAETHHVIPLLLNRVARLGVNLASFATRQASLEDVFVKLTGRHIDDEESANVG